MKRRKFITVSAMSVPMISLFPANLSSINREKNKGKIEKRSLGKTGEKLSMIGFGGIVVELKAVSALTDEHRGQVLNYLRATGMKLGILVNFGNPKKLEWERIVLT